jgi:hypothetical protein
VLAGSDQGGESEAKVGTAGIFLAVIGVLLLMVAGLGLFIDKRSLDRWSDGFCYVEYPNPLSSSTIDAGFLMVGASLCVIAAFYHRIEGLKFGLRGFEAYFAKKALAVTMETGEKIVQNEPESLVPLGELRL